MSIYGIAGFVEGFTGGVDTANKWKDRKRDQARQDRLDKMDAESHERRMRILDQNIAATDKSVADQKFYEDTYGDAVDATKTAMDGGTAPAQPTVSTTGATSGLPPPTGLLPMGIPGMPQDRPKVAPQGMPTPEELMQRYGSQPGVVNAPTVGAPTGPGPMSGPGPVPNGSVEPVVQPVPQPGTQIVPPMAMPANPVLQTEGPNGERIPAQLYGRGILPRRYGEYPGAAVDPAAPLKTPQELEMMRLTAIRDGQGNRVTTDLRRQADDRIAAIDPSKAGFQPGPAAVDSAKPAPAPVGPRVTDPKAALSATFQGALRGPLEGKAPASAPPEVKELSDTAAKAMAATTTPAMEAASTAATRGLPATDKKPTEANRKKFAGDFMDHYREVGAPMVYEALVSKGEFAKAEAFREFLDKDATKAGMENWARAAFAATVGDMDTFAEEIMQAYDRLDYFPDGTTIDRDASGFTKDKDGNITGAKLTFKDEKTGNTWDRVFTDPNDLVKMGITLLAPEQAFEFYFEQQATAAANAKGIAADEKSAAKEQQDRIDSVAKIIFEKSVGLDGVPTITYGQAVAQATQELSGQGAAPAAPGAGGPPVVRRPEG